MKKYTLVLLLSYLLSSSLYASDMLAALRDSLGDLMFAAEECLRPVLPTRKDNASRPVVADGNEGRTDTVTNDSTLRQRMYSDTSLAVLPDVAQSDKKHD